MRIRLFAILYRIPASRARDARMGHAFWRMRIYGVCLFERCECDNVQGCIAFRESGVFPAGIDDDTGEPYPAYDPRDDCSHCLRPPHRHSFVGQLLDTPVRWPR